MSTFHPSSVHFVGTIPLQDTEEVFRTAAEILGEHLVRIPDGETGERNAWIWTQVPVLLGTGKIVNDPVQTEYGELTRLRLAAPSAEFEFGDLGYAAAARASYQTFRKLKEEGVLGAGVRFQVCFPTPLSVLGGVMWPESAQAVEPHYERAMLAELAEIVRTVPAEDLAVQWDCCLEVLGIGGSPLFQPWFDDVWAGVVDRMRRLGEAVPSNVEVGYHLCYGDFQAQRQVNFDDAGTLVSMANQLAAQLDRPLSFLHLPVRDDIDPQTYLAPLRELRLDPKTTLYLGLISHNEDAAEARRRGEVASQFVAGFGVATECGFGRRDPQNVRPLLEKHRALCA